MPHRHRALFLALGAVVVAHQTIASALDLPFALPTWAGATVVAAGIATATVLAVVRSPRPTATTAGRRDALPPQGRPQPTRPDRT